MQTSKKALFKEQKFKTGNNGLAGYSYSSQWSTITKKEMN